MLNTGDVDLIVFDFDGVLTDNRVLVLEDGCEAVFCNRADGLAFDMFRMAGVSRDHHVHRAQSSCRLRGQES